jgi:hypothetical protein
MLASPVGMDQHASNSSSTHTLRSPPAPKPGRHTHSADEDAVVFVGIHMPTGQVLLVA